MHQYIVGRIIACTMFCLHSTLHQQVCVALPTQCNSCMWAGRICKLASVVRDYRSMPHITMKKSHVHHFMCVLTCLLGYRCVSCCLCRSSTKWLAWQLGRSYQGRALWHRSRQRHLLQGQEGHCPQCSPCPCWTITEARLSAA